MEILNNTRRKFISSSACAVGAVALVGCSGLFGGNANAKSGKKFKITRTPAEWKKRLGSARYRIMRLEGTERPFSSPLDREKRAGIFACAGCNLGLYSSKTKFDSGTGWPSFWAPIASNRIGTSTDRKLGYTAHRGPLRPLRRTSGSHLQ